MCGVLGSEGEREGNKTAQILDAGGGTAVVAETTRTDTRLRQTNRTFFVPHLGFVVQVHDSVQRVKSVSIFCALV